MLLGWFPSPRYQRIEGTLWRKGNGDSGVSSVRQRTEASSAGVCAKAQHGSRSENPIRSRPNARASWTAGQEKRPEENPGRNTRFPYAVSKESRGGDPYRSQDLPYCTFALLTHASFAGPASASHFSIATLYSASRFVCARVLAGFSLLRRRILARIGRYTVDLGVRLALDQPGFGFLYADVLAVARQVVAFFDGDVVVRLSARNTRVLASLWRVLVRGFGFSLGDVVLALGFRDADVLGVSA